MSVIAKPPNTHLMTAEEFSEFLDRPENENRFFELVRGELIELSRPMLPHGFVCHNVSRILGNFTFAQKRGFITANDTGVILERDPDTVRGPDVAYYKGFKRFADLPFKWAESPPRLAVEVLSPNDRADQVNEKITDYLELGVEVVWIVDPALRTVTVYTSENGPRKYDDEAELTCPAVLPGFTCHVADFFFMPEEEAAKPARKKKKK